MSRLPHRYGMLAASDCVVEIGDVLVAEMDGADANLYYPNDPSQGLDRVFAGRICGIIETMAIKKLCESDSPMFRVVAEPEASAIYTIELTNAR